MSECHYPVDTITVIKVPSSFARARVFPMSLGVMPVVYFEFDSAKSPLASLDVKTKESHGGRKLDAVRREYRLVYRLELHKNGHMRIIESPIDGDFDIFGTKATSIAIEGGLRVSGSTCEAVVPTVKMVLTDSSEQTASLDLDMIDLWYETEVQNTCLSDESSDRTG